ncbi:MAG: hypothetical protein UU48_C0006G0038 [Candidatus Uhrbacteria bacterium GW2011_GWF2_41_16]|uniref:Uncharacterized protein n=2 Tax=Candidatus Uhriibacteriota TaxID=1752732 RepID=A0A0G0VAJ1_9BACT|nr:MAG: hypothetical protein UU35_C0007G0095 [Candidatus Uhrbacteria bacterium GW2011_GWC2_41_11]KKR97998.1 MAG: hypothetical protein UU48_C0006G0038 [Candidatus Uhrbacteria bacterium GW2011_GWF2_41_16]HBO99632.1 hypothetical protein [Candidatus Uhrbacteria bacterium]
MKKNAFILLLVLFVGVGCVPSSTPLQKTTENEEQKKTEVVSSQTSSSASSETEISDITTRRGRLRDKLTGMMKNGSPRQILLLDSSCESATYTKEAKEGYREKDLGTFTVIIASFDEGKAPVVDGSDSCLKMSFPARDFASLKKMLNLLSEDLQKTLESSNVSVTIQEDLPGACDKVAEYIARRNPSLAEKAYARCKVLQDKQKQEQDSQEGNDDTLYDGNSISCTVAPDAVCSPGMDTTQYVKYAMGFITPMDASVTSEAARYSDIEAVYQAMQVRPWQSDTSLFGCSDKFQLPKYYLSTSPSITSSMECGMAVGDCEDQADTFSSLLIASGLFDASEVRTALGMVQFGNRPWDVGGHAFTEVYVGDHWFPVDAVFGNTCDEKGNCTNYNADDLIDWDYFNYVEYPVIEYWGWANNEWYYIPSTGEGTAGIPAWWKEESKTTYEVGS